MKLRVLALLMSLAVMPLAVMAQKASNPIITHMYTADPSAHVFNDTLWVYPSHDRDNAASFSMEDYHVFSTTDMQHWTDWGVIFNPLQQTTWAQSAAWAPDCIEHNGKYYLYYPTDKRHIGVAVGDTPHGPFHDPLGHPLISIDTPGVICDRDFIDPCVFIDTTVVNGRQHIQPYLFMGQNTVCAVRLNDDMISYDHNGGNHGVYIIEGVKDFFEAVWVNKHDGKYYMSYSDGPFRGHEPQIAYCTATNPLGPYNYQGIILDPVNSGTNHHSIVSYHGQDYLFYHTADISRYKALGFHCGVRRNVCVDSLFYNADGTIRKVKQTISLEKVRQNTISSNLHTIGNGAMTMSVTNYGARIQTLRAFGQDVVLGFDTLEHYAAKKQNFGAVVGRYIGRILGGRLTIDGTSYQLQTGGNGDCSHGGTPSFSQRFWELTAITDSTMTMRYVSPDGENGFPGQLTLDVTYTLQHDALRIDYAATTTKPTVLNPSNHSFFNLTGNLSNDILDEELWIDGDSIAAYDKDKRVTGQLAAVAATPFDFRTSTAIGQRIDADDAQLAVTKGYDHCYRLNTQGDISRPCARLTDAITGMTMSVYTTEPAMQIYTANGHAAKDSGKAPLIGKDGLPYYRRNAICFETMHFPDSPNKPQWPSTLLRPGETFHSTTIFRFEKQFPKEVKN